MIQSKHGETVLHPVYETDFQSGVSYLQFDKVNHILVLGMESGEVKMLRVYITENSYITKNLVDEVASIKVHKSKVIGVEIDFTSGYVFSISNDPNLEISEYNYQSKIKTLKISNYNLTCLLYNQSNHLLVISDNSGSLYFYSVSSPILPKKLQSIHSQFSPVCYLKLSHDDSLLIAGCVTGEIHTFKVFVSRDGMQMEQLASYVTQDNMKVIKGVDTKDYFIVGSVNGSISVFSKDSNRYPECKI